jgi:hypothetical protein
MAASQPNSKPGRNTNETRKSIGVIWLEKIQLTRDEHFSHVDSLLIQKW